MDFENGRVTLPETKTGRRVHHFQDAALVVMRSRPWINRNDHVFAVDARGPLTYRRPHTLRGGGAAGGTDGRSAARPAAHGHDERGGAGVGTHVLRDLLGHRTAAMAERYVRSVGSPVADAREAVGSAMAAAMAGEGARD